MAGVPPDGGRPIIMHLAAGTIEGYLRDHVANVDLHTHPEIDTLDPIFPWGRYAGKWELAADLNPGRADPHLLREPSGFKFPIVWRGRLSISTIMAPMRPSLQKWSANKYKHVSVSISVMGIIGE